MKRDWKLSVGTIPGLIFGVRSYVESSRTDYVLYLLFIDICLTIYNDKISR